MAEVADINALRRVDIPGYTVVRKIGDGGMAVVYLALQDSLKRNVALKVLRAHAGDDPELVDRFMHEAKTIAQLDHPNIVSIHEVGQTPTGKLYYSMPFLEDGDLRGFSYQDEREIIDLMKRLCDGLAYAHEQGVVHRDIKPENVLFDRFGNAQIADFGIALSQGNRRWTKEGHVVGSAQYMSPEQSQARVVDARSDIYSLGIILYELLVGKTPYDQDDDVAILVSHVNDPIPLLPPEKRHWQPLMRRCLAKSPEDRFQTAEALKQAVAEVPLAGLRRIFTCWGVGVQEWYWRWRRTLILSLVLAVTATIGATAAYIHLRRSWAQPTVVTSVPPRQVVAAEAPPEPQLLAPPHATLPAGPLADGFEGPAQPTAVLQPPPESESNPELPAELASDSAIRSDSTPAVADETIQQLLAEAQQRLAQDRLTKPADDNAADRLITVLQAQPQQPQAVQAMADLSRRYAELASAALAQGSYARAAEYRATLQSVWSRAGLDGEDIAAVAELIEPVSRQAIEDAGSKLDRAAADAALDAVAALLSPLQRAALQQRVDSIPSPGTALSDSRGTTTLVIPRSLQRPNGERREIGHGFAASPHEVTRGEYARFADERRWPETDCRHKGGPPSLFGAITWRRPANIEQDDNHPVICVSWQDAMSYAEWLSARSGHIYRLPTEEEWLHMAWPGHDATEACQTGNVAGTESGKLRYIGTTLDCDDGQIYTAAVGSYRPNFLGLFDLRGNVREWTLTCAARESGTSRLLDRLSLKDADRCERRAVRGTGWVDGADTSMLALIELINDDHAHTSVGFRLVRDLAAEWERENE